MCMRMRWRGLACLGLCAVLAWFLADAGEVRRAAAEALALCGRSVIPALFPFLVLSILLISLGFGELVSPYLAGLMTPLFRLPGCASSALLLGLAGGYPIGAQTAARLYREGALTRGEAERLLTFCNNSNPVFLISVLGAGAFGSVRTGVWLWLIHILSALLAGLAFRRGGEDGSPQYVTRQSASQGPSFSTALVEAVRGGLSGMLSVCAFVIFFYVLASPLASLGGRLGPLLVGVTELFSMTPLLPADGFGFVLASGCAGWGGLSVLCQTAAVLEGSGLRLRTCLLGKILQGLLAAALALALRGYVLG